VKKKTKKTFNNENTFADKWEKSNTDSAEMEKSLNRKKFWKKKLNFTH